MPAAASARLSSYLRRMVGLVQAAGGEKSVIVTETGWPGNGQPVGAAVPSAENAMRYFVDVPKMRSSTSDNYLTTGIAYAHRAPASAL